MESRNSWYFNFSSWLIYRVDIMYFLERWTCPEWFIIKRVIVNENSKSHCDLSAIWEERAWRALTDTLKQRYFFHPGNGRLTFVIHRVLIYLKLDNSSCLLLFLPFAWISFFTSFIVISLLHVFDKLKWYSEWQII